VHLDVVRRGVPLGTLPLAGAPRVLVGRVDVCEVVCAHASVSRHHAMLVFGKNSEVSNRGPPLLWVYDLGSTHGTRLNKKRISPREFVPCFDSDQLCFGESSRLFIISATAAAEHREEAASQAETIDKLPAEAAQVAATATEEDVNARVTAAKKETGAEGILTVSKRAEVARARRVARHDAFQGKQAKRDRMIAEMDAIEAKEHTGDLSEGQKRQIGILQKLIAALDADIEAESELILIEEEGGGGDSYVEQQSRQARLRRMVLEAERVADDVDDVTGSGSTPSSTLMAVDGGGLANGFVDTAESLSLKYDNLCTAAACAEAELRRTEVAGSFTSRSGDVGEGEEVDELDSFMLGNQASLVAGAVAAKCRVAMTAMRERDRIGRLLAFAQSGSDSLDHVPEGSTDEKLATTASENDAAVLFGKTEIVADVTTDYERKVIQAMKKRRAGPLASSLAAANWKIVQLDSSDGGDWLPPPNDDGLNLNR
jgi:hypothetical protein